MSHNATNTKKSNKNTSIVKVTYLTCKYEQVLQVPMIREHWIVKYNLLKQLNKFIW